MMLSSNKIKLSYLSFVLFFNLIIHAGLTQAGNWVYEVRDKDNLWNLTVDHLIDISCVKKVQKLNNIKDPWHIMPGTKIIIPRQWIRQFPALVRIHNLQGSAQVIDDGAEKPRDIKAGDIVMLGDTVLTNKDSTLVLGFLDGSRILLQENSRLKINKLMSLENTGMSDSNLLLEAGRLETQVSPNKGNVRRFNIQTPVSVTSVRGTDYRVSAESGSQESRTEVVGGKVEVTAVGKTQLLLAGFGNITKKEQKPMPPVELLAAPDIKLIPSFFDQVPIQFAMPVPKKDHGYRFQVAKTEHFSDILFDKTSHSSTVRGPDLSDGYYYIRLRGIDDQQLEGHNAQGKIEINAKPEAPLLMTPKAGDGFLLESSVSFSWAKQQSIDAYHLQISRDPGFSDLLLDKQNIKGNQLDITEEMKVGKYYWRIAATDQDGDGPFSDSLMFRRIVPAPEFEVPEISEDKVFIRSRKGLPGQRYHFQMSEDESFNELMFDEYTDEPGFEIPKPGSGEYFIRVQTIDPDGYIGPFAAAQTIEIPFNYYWLLSLLPLLALIAL